MPRTPRLRDRMKSVGRARWGVLRSAMPLSFSWTRVRRSSSWIETVDRSPSRVLITWVARLRYRASMRSHILLGRVLRPSIRANSPRSLNPRTQDLIVLGLYPADWISPSCSRRCSLRSNWPSQFSCLAISVHRLDSETPNPGPKVAAVRRRGRMRDVHRGSQSVFPAQLLAS